MRPIELDEAAVGGSTVPSRGGYGADRV